MAEVSTQEKLAQRYKEYQDCRQNLKDFTSLEADSVNTLEDIAPIINDVRANLKKVIVKEGEKFEGTNSFHMLNENLSGNRTFKCTLSNEGSLYFAVAVRADEGERTILSVTLPPESQKLDRLSVDNLNSFLMQVYDAEGEREGIFFPLRGPDNEQAQRQYIHGMQRVVGVLLQITERSDLPSKQGKLVTTGREPGEVKRKI